MDMKNRGMTLFIAVTIMGILLFISFAVVNITIKSTLLASSGRDSQFAFYAADSGLECALYWDSQKDAFATSTSGDVLDFKCAGSADLNSNQAILGTSTLSRIGGGGDTNPTSTFGFVMNQGLNSVPHCAIVTVYKYYADKSSPLDGYKETLMTYIKSRGYNTCEMTNPRRVERGIEVTY